MAEWVQMDLFEDVATAPCKLKKLCDSWMCAVKNDNGVFTTNTRTFIEKDKRGNSIELQVALLYPHIYGAVSLQSCGPDFYGIGRPLTEESTLVLSVDDDEWHADCAITEALNSEILDDPNLDDDKQEMFLKLVKNLVNKALKEIAE